MLTLSKYHKWLINLPILMISFMASGQGFLLTGGSNVVISGNAQIVIKDGGFTNNGSFNAGTGSVSFRGSTSTANSFIGGSSETGFYNLVLNKTGNGIKLKSNISVVNSLTFTSGDSLFLNNYNIDLGNTGSLIGETNNRRVTGLTGGYIQRTQILNAPSAFNPGNIGIELTSAQDLGSTIIRRGHKLIPGMPEGTISRYYDVIPTNNSALDAIVKFYYLDGETIGLSEYNLMLYSSPNHGIYWDFLGISNADMSLNYVNKSPVARMNMFILAGVGHILPVQLVYFNAKLVSRQTQLNWMVTDESGVDHYEIERSADGIHFNTLMSVNKKNTNSGTQFYESNDHNPMNGFNYYRLKILDGMSTYKYSRIVLINLTSDADEGLGIYPNPARDIIKIIFTSKQNERLELVMFDAKGSRVNTKNVSVITGRNEIPWDIHLLPAGAYMIQLQGNSSKTIQFIKQ